MLYYHLVGDIVIPVGSDLQKEGLDRLKKYYLIIDMYKKENQIPKNCKVIRITEMEKIIKIKRKLFTRPEYVRLIVGLYLAYFTDLYKNSDEDIEFISDLIYDTIKDDFSKKLFDKYQLTLKQFSKLERYHHYLIEYFNTLYTIPEFNINC